MSKECCKCCHFRGYYSKGYCSFYRENFGYCGIIKGITEKHNGCDKFNPKQYKREIKRAAVINALNDAITDINTIKMILEESELEK